MKTIQFAVGNWPGHLPGQHADVRLTAEDGYRAERSYSIASPPEVDALELTVDRLDDGEVSRSSLVSSKPATPFNSADPLEATSCGPRPGGRDRCCW